MRDDFGVGLGCELVAFGFQLRFQFQVVLNDSVVHHDDGAMTVAVRVSVLLGGSPVRRPACVPDAVSAVNRVLSDYFFEVSQLACGAPPPDEVALRNEQRRRLDASIQLLPVPQREAIVLCFEGFSYGEMAAILGISANAVMLRCQRAKNRLRAIMERRPLI